MSEFTIREGESVSFTLTYGTYGDYREHSPQEPVDVGAGLPANAQLLARLDVQRHLSGSISRIG